MRRIDETALPADGTRHPIITGRQERRCTSGAVTKRSDAREKSDLK